MFKFILNAFIDLLILRSNRGTLRTSLLQKEDCTIESRGENWVVRQAENEEIERSSAGIEKHIAKARTRLSSQQKKKNVEGVGGNTSVALRSAARHILLLSGISHLVLVFPKVQFCLVPYHTPIIPWLFPSFRRVLARKNNAQFSAAPRFPPER